MTSTTLSPFPQPPRGAPWGRRGALYNFDTASLLGLTLSPETLAVVQQIARAADAQRDQEAPISSHGARIAAVAQAMGCPGQVAGRCGVLVDAFSLASDLADNIADAEEDAANGRSFQELYAGIPYARLVATPALLVGAVIAAIPRVLPAPALHPTHLTTELMRVLDVMARGQSRGFDEDARIEEISAVQGRLYAMPWWALEGPDGVMAAEVEAWAVPWARTWQLNRDRVENPGDVRVEAALRAACAQALSRWPEGEAFQGDGPFAAARLLPALT